MKSLTTLVFLFWIYNPLFAQLKVNYVDSAESVVTDVLLSKNAGVELLYAKYMGSHAAIGTFSSHMVYNEFIDSGIVLSTGNVMDAIGPNLEGGKSGKNVESGVGFLSQLAGSKTLDAAVLAFDFIPSTDSFCFKYIFASEEYPEYVNRGVNDVFAFVLINMENGEKKNIATLPDGKTPICVDEINHIKNKEYFILNGVWEPENAAKWRNDSTKGEAALMIEFDGFTTVLNAGTRVEPGKKYRLILAISDVGDDVYDSAIFLKANSFKSEESNQIKNLLTNLKIEDDGSFSGAKQLNFEFGSAEMADESSYKFLDTLALAIAKYKPKQIEIIGHTDNVGSEKDNQELSEQRANHIKEYLIEQGVDATLISSKGKGESEPINPEKPELNRRVEFMFRF
jgi:outer membrane protein OmpA-like peptidoglycan-associated protein